MIEKYEKPELISQKMELNVLRAECKKASIDGNGYTSDLGCSYMPCELQDNTYS